jgi:hypothetical protein
MANPKCLFLHDPGVGKTPPVCVMQQHLWQDHQAGTVWSMPKALLNKNYDEILRFTDLTSEDVVIVDGTPKKVKAAIESSAKVRLMGFDRFARCWKDQPSFVQAHHVDEIHMGFGGAESGRTQEFLEAGRKWPWFIGMTGTLVNGRLDTCWPAIHVIEPRYYGSYKSFYHYHAFVDDLGEFLGWRNHAKLSKILSIHGIRRTFEMVHGPEAKVQFTEVVDMAPRQRELYDQFEKQAFLELEKFFIDGTQPGVSFIRARQIMEHPNEFPDLTADGEFVDILGGEAPAKEQAIEVHFSDHVRTGKPVIVFASMKPQQRRIVALAERMGMTVALMNGDTSTKRRGEIDEAFRAGLIQVLVCSPAVASVGFNWQFWGDQEVDHMIFASLDFKDTSFFQAYRRAMREKRRTPLRITILEYLNSLDQRVFEINRQKAADAHLVDPTRQKLELSRVN